MKLWPRKPRSAPATPTRANTTRIAVLENDLLGIPPKPGTAAAAVLTLRQAGTCIEHDPLDVAEFGKPPGTQIICGRCGRKLELVDSKYRAT